MSEATVNRRLFEGNPALEIWIEGKSQYSDSKILLTISNKNGEETVLITPENVVSSNPKIFVQAPPERIITKSQARQLKIKRSFSYFGYIISAVLITFSLLSVTGYTKARIVLTDSMAPSIKSGDIVILANTPRAQPKLGDVVAYTGRRFSGEIVGTFTHRIIGGNQNEGFLVKGDANPSPDVQRPKLDDISGVVIAIIPAIGRFLTPKMLMILVPFILGLWLVLDSLKNEP